MSTVAERTVRIPDQPRVIFIDLFGENRTVRIREQNRVVFVERRPNSADRTVFASED